MKISSYLKRAFFATILFSLVLFVFVVPVLAQGLELNYPNISPKISPPETTRAFLPNYIRYIFVLSLIIASLAAFFSIVYGGFQHITSAGNPSKLSDARGRIKSGLLGLTILLSSYLILSTINPQLIVLKVPGINVQQGIILFSNSENCTDFPSSQILNEGQDFLKIKASVSSLPFTPDSFYSFNNNEDLTVQFYSKENYKPKDNPFFDSNNSEKPKDPPSEPLNTGCNDIRGGTAKSVRLNWKTPGVYLFVDNNFKGTSFLYINDSNLPNGADNEISSVLLKNSPTTNLNYGAILHEDKDFKGKIHIALKNENVSETGVGKQLNNDVSSVTVFNPDENVSGTATVTLCRNPDCEPEDYDWKPFFQDLKSAEYSFGFEDRGSVNGFPEKYVRGIPNLTTYKWVPKGEGINCGRTPYCPQGVSAIKIETGAPYLIILFDEINYMGNALATKGTINNLKTYDRPGFGSWNDRSEERRVGKECRSRWSPYH